MTVESWTIIKQIGINRSGTTYFEKLIRLNFAKAEVLFLKDQLGDKHHTYTREDMETWLGVEKHKIKWEHLKPYLNEVKITIQVRDPHSWSLGFLKHLKCIGKSKGRKLKDPAAHATLIREWLNPKYQAWRKMIEKDPAGCCAIRFEELIRDFRKVLGRLIKKWDLHKLPGKLRDITGVVHSSGKIAARKYKGQDYYAQKRYIRELAPGVRKAIEASTDWDAAGFFGYTPGW